jgi:hypothetical protein
MAGIQERTNRTIFERVRSATTDSNIPKELWTEILKAQVYITNRVATSTVKNKTPYESFMEEIDPGKDHKPDLSHLHVLGCRAFVHIPQQRQVKSAKLDQHAEEGILVGFEGTHIYRVWIPIRLHKLVRTSHVTFNEGSNEITELLILPAVNLEAPQMGEPDGTFDELPERIEPENQDDVHDLILPDAIQAKRGRGRPKGSKNKPKELSIPLASSFRRENLDQPAMQATASDEPGQAI